MFVNFLLWKLQMYIKIEEKQLPCVHHPASAIINIQPILFHLHLYPLPPPHLLWGDFEAILICHTITSTNTLISNIFARVESFKKT